jgi:serine O-acetyltransferase
MFMFEDFRADIDRYVFMSNDRQSWLHVIIGHQGLWALAEYRFNRWVNRKVKIPFIRQILRLFGFIWHKLIQIITGIDLPHQANLGRGIFINHFGGIIINPEVTIGNYCNLSPDIVIGVGGRGEERGCPTIGARVFIGPGAKIFGKITIGDDVAIGANAVVTKDLPEKAVAVGAPAKIINYKSSSDYIAYRQNQIDLSSARSQKEKPNMQF